MPTISTAAELGQTIRAARKAAGMSQTELAQASGCSQRFVSQLERGKPTAELGKALNVMTALGLDIVVSQRANAGNAHELVDAAIAGVAQSFARKQKTKPRLATYLKEGAQ